MVTLRGDGQYLAEGSHLECDAEHSRQEIRLWLAMSCWITEHEVMIGCLAYETARPRSSVTYSS